MTTRCVVWKIGRCECAHFAAKLHSGRRGILNYKWRQAKVRDIVLDVVPYVVNFVSLIQSQNVVSLIREIFSTSTPENVHSPSRNPRSSHAIFGKMDAPTRLNGTTRNMRATRRKMASLQASSNSMENTSHDVRRVEWTIPGISERLKSQEKGLSIWSPEFSARGINGIQLEFFPNGRESTTIGGFCAV